MDHLALTQIVLLVSVGLFTAIAAVWDAKTRKLPNLLTVPACLLGVLFHTSSGAIVAGWSGAWNGFLFSLGGFAIGFGVLFVLWIIGGTAAGDVKMMGALGAWLGFIITLQVFFVSAFLIVLGMLGYTLLHLVTGGPGRLKNRIDELKNQPANPKREEKVKGRPVPFGVPLAVATWLVLAVGTIINMSGS